MNIVPCGHRLVIKPFALEEHDEVYARAKRAGLELLPIDERKQQVNIDQGTVVAIGPSAFKDFGGDAWCSVGDVIGFAKFGGKYIKDPGTKEDFLVLNDEDVICVLKKDEA
jgi:co-chaperonin GroES (HSP10)